ncbi:MAG: hypothetical protein UY10_C0058G0008 [Microgenomates group bacterium GW2011_GWA2_47_8]|nr:MAG: hypothetical protein UY10_C0058G0008 [Microgenomates group bacterium GW2011_GWA2_47_8]
MSDFRKGILFLFISVLLYSIMPVLIRMLGAGAIPPASQVFLRYIVAFMCAAAYFRLTRQKFSVKKKDLPFLAGIALVGYALTNLFYTYGILLTQVGTVLFIFYCFSIMTPILAKIFLKERINTAKIIALVLGFAALVFLFRPGPVATWKLGALFAFASAIGQSVYIIGRKKLGSIHSATFLLANTFVGVIAVGLIAFITEAGFYTGPSGIQHVQPTTWLVTILFGIDNFAAWLFMTRGFQLVAAGTGSLVMLAENLIGVAFAFLFFREIPSASTLTGGLLILIASTLVIAKGEKA